MKEYSLPIVIRFFDVDMNHHVNNAVYFTYMENVRTEIFMQEFMQYQSKGIHFVVAEASCKYKAPILLEDKVKCEMKLQHTGATHFTITFTFKNQQTKTTYAVGINKMAFIKAENNRPIPIPEDFLNKYLQ